MTDDLSAHLPILITGGKGMLAGALVDVAVERFRSTINRTDLLAPDRETLNIQNMNNVRKWIHRKEPGTVLNAAAYTNVDGCEKNPDYAMEINGTAPGQLARICHEKGIPFVHYSTDYVFDGTSSTPYRETDPTNPINRYGETKREGEKNTRKHHPGSLILRSSWLYGRHRSNFVDGMRKKLTAGESISIVTDQIGSPTPARLLAHATYHLLQQGETGLFHATCSGHTSWFGLTREIKKHLELPGTLKKIESHELQRAAERPAYSVLNSQKLLDTGFDIPHWKNALHEYLDNTGPHPDER